ncbi:hypothetical protein TrST_g8443 [Triparma strigata]|uniref:Peptidase C1A papain C-terminal domain-containing protein n=1 Tax=Triparma strigata TaxID=1606541 RepID=A0A9W7AC37_9STRA|nr:hypothetical protein TrST_g8443 [Triparma strigata]
MMSSPHSVLLALLLALSSVSPSSAGCGLTYKDLHDAKLSSDKDQVPQTIHAASPSSSLPTAWDWRNMNATNFITPPSYQMLPSQCGSCWAFASTGALADRYKIALNNQHPDIVLSVQSLLDCGSDAGSCNGGNALAAYEYIHEAGGITDSTCLPYKGVDNSNWAEVDCVDRMCQSCDRFGTCSYTPQTGLQTLYKISDCGWVKGVYDMKAEIMNGPIACLMYAHSEDFESYTGGIITNDTKYDGITHVVVVTGWGVDSQTGMEFWRVKNSFGSEWGEMGFYRVEIGKDIYNMESNECAFAVPSEETIESIKKRSGL